MSLHSSGCQSHHFYRISFFKRNAAAAAMYTTMYYRDVSQIRGIFSASFVGGGGDGFVTEDQNVKYMF